MHSLSYDHTQFTSFRLLGKLNVSILISFPTTKFDCLRRLTDGQGYHRCSTCSERKKKRTGETSPSPAAFYPVTHVTPVKKFWSTYSLIPIRRTPQNFLSHHSRCPHRRIIITLARGIMTISKRTIRLPSIPFSSITTPPLLFLI